MRAQSFEAGFSTWPALIPETKVLNAVALTTRHHIRHLRVLKNGKFDGIVSMGDLVAEVISGQAFTIDQLHKYIGQTPS
jgi:CBS domain-containing protein